MGHIEVVQMMAGSKGFNVNLKVRSFALTSVHPYRLIGAQTSRGVRKENEESSFRN
jgi:hypothetical protein